MCCNTIVQYNSTYLTAKRPPQAQVFRNPGYAFLKIASEVINFGDPLPFEISTNKKNFPLVILSKNPQKLFVTDICIILESRKKDPKANERFGENSFGIPLFLYSACCPLLALGIW